MLGYDVPKEAFVATATAIALFVDATRLPVYLAAQGGAIAQIWSQVLIAIGGVVVGTLLGKHILGRLSQPVFRRMIALLPAPSKNRDSRRVGSTCIYRVPSVSLTFPPLSLTGYVPIGSSAGPALTAPLRQSNCEPCQGHCTTPPIITPPAREPPR